MSAPGEAIPARTVTQPRDNTTIPTWAKTCPGACLHLQRVTRNRAQHLTGTTCRDCGIHLTAAQWTAILTRGDAP
jgi:hypothetical protein